MPAQLRDQLRESAARSGRSLNAELVQRLDPSRHRGLETRRIALAAAGALGVILSALMIGVFSRDSATQVEAKSNVGEALESGAISPDLRQNLAASTKFSPGAPEYEQGEAAEGEGAGDGAQDWTMHASPGTAVPLAAITGSRKDWAALKSRGNADAKLGDHGRWENLGPDNAVYPLNPFRNRDCHVPSEYVAAGAAAHSIIDLHWSGGKFRYRTANTAA